MKLSTKHKPESEASELYSDNILLNNKGIALVLVMILSLISLAIMSGLIYMVTSGTQVSGIGKRYSTALEAGKSGRDVVYQVMSARGNPFTAAEATDIFFSITDPGTCLPQKLNFATNTWAGFGCDSSIDIITDPPDADTYDMILQLGNNPAYTVYTKIVDTVVGNSGKDEGLLKTGVVISNPGEVAVGKIPYLYTIEIVAENATNPMERSRLSLLYQY
jgi:hypothetical protein